MRTVLSADDLGLVNCCVPGCRRELLGEATAWLLESGRAVTDCELPPRVAGRVHGRPVCGACLKAAGRPVPQVADVCDGEG